MKTPALVAVDQEPEAFAALFEAATARGVRIGWLDLGAAVEPPGALARAATVGAAKAVSATSGQVIVLKPTRGAAVLRDLLREHFLGCAVVLVRGHAGRPRLQLDSDGARLELAAERPLRLSMDELLRELQRPRNRA